MKYVGTGIYLDYPISETNAKGYTRYFEYDANGRLTEKTDRNGRVTTYTYDAAGRLTSESWLDSSNNAVNTFTYQYDILGNLLSAFDGVSSYVYTYDTMNRLDTMLFTFDGQTALFDYAYDLVGRQTQSALTLNNVADRTINIEYDYLGRAISAELTGNVLNDILAEFDYNAVGALTDVRRFEWDDTDELYNLIAQSQYQYNARNQITSITHQDSNNNNTVSHGYLYNADGNISQYTNSLDGSVLYDYDFLGQLTGANYSNLDITDESYQYDLNGNRELVTNANGDLVVYTTGTNNELTSDGAYSYAYDAEGNRISKTNAAGTERELYEWDYRNRLSSVTKQEYNATTQEWETVQIVEYAYDYNNVLIRKVLDANGDGVSDSKTLFLPENYQTAVQLDDADLSDSTYETVSHRYLWTPQNQDKLLADVTPTESLWTLTDHLGTVRDIIQNTQSGLVVPAHVIYDAYGNVLSCKDANGIDIESPVLFGFTGKYFDADTQLQNNVNRWYDSIIGRWLSTDPIGFNGNDTNLYRYVGNKSLSKLDFIGLYEKDIVVVEISRRPEKYTHIKERWNSFIAKDTKTGCCYETSIIIEYTKVEKLISRYKYTYRTDNNDTYGSLLSIAGVLGGVAFAFIPEPTTTAVGIGLIISSPTLAIGGIIVDHNHKEVLIKIEKLNDLWVSGWKNFKVTQVEYWNGKRIPCPRSGREDFKIKHINHGMYDITEFDSSRFESFYSDLDPCKNYSFAKPNPDSYKNGN